MGIGEMLCKLGLHNGEPIVDEAEKVPEQQQQIADEVQNREVMCVRCGKVYTELVGASSVWYGHP